MVFKCENRQCLYNIKFSCIDTPLIDKYGKCSKYIEYELNKKIIGDD